MKNSRVWFLRNGNHLCRGFAGRASTEYGDKTTWIRVPFGVLVLRGRRFTFAEVLEMEGDYALRLWLQWKAARIEDGIED